MSDDETTDHEPDETAVAVSPTDRSSDREQSDADQVLTVERLDALVTVSTALTKSAADVAESTQLGLAVAAAARKRLVKVVAAVAVLMVLLLTPMLVILVSSLGARGDLQDCVQPSGTCFQDGQKRTADLVIDLDRQRVLVIACARESATLPTVTQRIAAINKCVEKYSR